MGVRTRAATQLGDGWLWPFWLERQLDASSSARVPPGHPPVLTDMTHRNWTSIGTLASSRRVMVDPCGLVTPWPKGWSLDWWIGADDRWHLPSRDAGIRQRLVAGTPVIETALRIPGGDAVQRVYAIAGQEDLVVVEIANRSPVPVAVALAVRPVNLEGLAVVERIAIHGRTVTVDGQPALLLARRPQVMAGATFADGDSALIVTSGHAGSSFPERLRCEAGLAQAAFVFPLPHGTSLSVAIPLTAERRTRWRGVARRGVARRGVARRGVESLPELPAVLPSSEDAAHSWEAQTRRGMRLELPAGRLADAVEANRRALLLFRGGEDDVWFRDAAYLISALDRYGFHGEAAELLRSYPGRQRRDTDGCALLAMAEHWRLTRDEDLLHWLLPSVAKAVRSIERMRQSRRRRRRRYDSSYGASFWGLRGLLEGATLLAAAGEEAAAATAARCAAGLAAHLDASVTGVVARLSTPAMPAGPRRALDPAVIGSLIACYPLGLLGPASAGVSAMADLIRSRFCVDRAVALSTSHTELGTYLTAQLALVELEAGDRRALGRLDWMVQVASPTFAWPEAVLPQQRGGCAGDGHDGLASSAFLTLVRNLLVREVRPAPAILVDAVGAAPEPAALALCSLLPDAWLGQGIEVHQAPTAYGQLSFAVRWHGERPALLWELAPRPDVGPVLISAPGLDPTWSTHAPTGDVLLSPLPAGSFS